MEKNDSPPRERWYAEVPPPPGLAASVFSLWEMRLPSTPGVTRVRILPNACIDIVLYASEPSTGSGLAAIVAPPHRSYVVGSTLSPFIVRSMGWRHVIGASLRPEGVTPILGMPASAIGERVAFLRDVIGAVGMSPKLFSRLVGFDRAARSLTSRGTQSWTEFALAHGYSDQAHFINEFREFAGVTPTEFEDEQQL